MTANAAEYLAHTDLDPSTVLNCASLACRERFVVAKGFAAELVVRQQGVVIFFCSQAWHLREVPTKHCGSA